MQKENDRSESKYICDHNKYKCVQLSFKIRAFILHIKTLRHMLFTRDMPKMQRPKEAKDEKMKGNTSVLMCHGYRISSEMDFKAKKSIIRDKIVLKDVFLGIYNHLTHSIKCITPKISELQREKSQIHDHGGIF